MGEMVLLLMGVALVLAGLLEARRRAPAIGRAAGLGAAAAGGLCIVAAIILLSSDGSPAPAGPVRGTITNMLGPGQLSEEITVVLGGRDAGVVKVDKQSPTASLTVTVPEAGRHDYRLEVTRREEGRAPVEVSNEGTVRIDGTSSIVVLSSEDGDTFLEAQG